jgi:hypothetical protein
MEKFSTHFCLVYLNNRYVSHLLIFFSKIPSKKSPNLLYHLILKKKIFKGAPLKKIKVALYFDKL